MEKMKDFKRCFLFISIIFTCACQSPKTPPSQIAKQPSSDQFIAINDSVKIPIPSGMYQRTDGNGLDSKEINLQVNYGSISWKSLNLNYSEYLALYPKESGPAPQTLVSRWLDILLKIKVYESPERDPSIVLTPILYDSKRQLLSFQISFRTTKLKEQFEQDPESAFLKDFRQKFNSDNSYKLSVCMIKEVARDCANNVPEGTTIFRAAEKCKVDIEVSRNHNRAIRESYKDFLKPINRVDRYVISSTPMEMSFIKLMSESSEPMLEQTWDQIWNKTIVVLNDNQTQQLDYAKSASKIAKSALPSIVMVVMQNTKGQLTSLGSGFFLSEHVLVTNYHVIKGASEGFIKRVGTEGVFKIDGVLGIDEAWDLALLMVSSVEGVPIEIGDSSSVETGDRVYAVGNPEGYEGTFSEGLISAVRTDDSGSLFQISAPISHGSSGGALLDSNGKAIGVTVAMIKDAQNLNFAIPISRISVMLESDFKAQTLASLNISQNKLNKKNN
jgi:hypothetical protein